MGKRREQNNISSKNRKIDFHSPLHSGVLELLLFFLGMLLLFQKLFGLSLGEVSGIYGGICLSSLIMVLLGLFLPERFRRYSYEFPLLPAVVLLLFRFPAVSGGCAAAANRLLNEWNLLHEDSFSLFQLGAGEASLPLFLLLFCLVMQFLLCGEEKRLWLLEIVAALMLGLAIILEKGDTLAFLLLLSGLLSYWLRCTSPCIVLRRYLWTGACFFSLCLSIAAGSSPLPTVLDFRDQSQAGIERIRYGEDTLPEGKLQEAWKLREEKEKIRLSVQSTEKKTLYLRAFTGDKYKDGVWKALSRTAFEGRDRGILSWLRKRNFYPLMQYGTYWQAGDMGEKENHVSIENQGANRKYFYETYSMLPSQSFSKRARNDNRFGSYAPFGIHSFQFDERSQEQPTELLMCGEWLWNPKTDPEKDYIQAEKVYRDFVYRHYTEVPEELRTDIEELFHEEELPKGVYAATVKIRRIMEQKLKYQETMQEVPEDYDPIRWFLRGNAGNSVLYASTAAEAFRSFGIPARYVEGYLYRPTENEKGEYHQDLTSADAHAWCEVYMDGMGWMPVDMTPGYYFSTYAMMEMMGAPDGVQKASIEEENSFLSELSDESAVGNSRKTEEILKKGGSIVLGLLVLAVLFITTVCVSVLILRQFLLMWGLFQAKKQEKSYVDYTWHRIRSLLWAMGIRAELGRNAAETEYKLRECMPIFQEGMYLDLNQLMEHFYYGGEESSLDAHEVQLLFRFLKLLEQEIRRLRLQDRMLVWYRDTRQLLKGKGAV